MILPENAELITYPEFDGGSSTKSFNLEENENFEINHGTFGNIKMTTLSLKKITFQKEKICWANYVDFTTEEQIWTSLSTQPKLIQKIIHEIMEVTYERGFKKGVEKNQNSIKKALGIQEYTGTLSNF